MATKILKIIKSNKTISTNLVEAGDLELDEKYTESCIEKLRTSRSLLK